MPQSTTAAPSVEFTITYTEILPIGCCRTENNGLGEQQTPYATTDRASCEADCTASSACYGYEWREWSVAPCN